MSGKTLENIIHKDRPKNVGCIHYTARGRGDLKILGAIKLNPDYLYRKFTRWWAPARAEEPVTNAAKKAKVGKLGHVGYHLGQRGVRPLRPYVRCYRKRNRRISELKRMI